MNFQIGPFTAGKPVLGLALGAGGPRGWAHLGVFRAFQESEIDFGIVAGTSIGALMGAFYSANALQKLEEFASGYSNQRKTLSLLDLRFRSGGVVEGNRLMRFVESILPVERFEDLDRKFAVVATELRTMKEIHFRSGKLMPAIRASISIPGFLTPQKIGDELYADGVMLNPVPVSLARKMGATVVIAVDLSPLKEKVDLSNFGGVVNRSGHSMIHRIRTINYRLCPPDIIIRPELPGYGFMDYHRTQEAIDEGYRAAKEKIPLIKRILSRPFHFRTRRFIDQSFVAGLTAERIVADEE